jgi:hypothetical protein
MEVGSQPRLGLAKPLRRRQENLAIRRSVARARTPLKTRRADQQTDDD